MPRKASTKEDLQTRLAELSGWQTATRDDGAVARTIHETRAMDQVYGLNEAAFFDELFHYTREIGAWPLNEDLDPKSREGASYPFIRARDGYAHALRGRRREHARDSRRVADG